MMSSQPTTLRIAGASLVPIRLRAPALGAGRVLLGDGGWRQGWELHVFAADGAVGRGEASPLPGYGGGEPTAVHDALAPLCGPFGRLRDAEIPLPGAERVRWLADACAVAGPEVPTWPAAARFALEAALLDLAAQATGRSMAEVLGGQDRALVDHALIADVEAARAAAAAAAAAGARPPVWKLKAGAAAWDDDEARIAAIAALAGPCAASLRVDANGGWDEPLAAAALASMAAKGVALCEEPLRGADPAALARLRAHGVAIAADESCRDLDRLRRLLDARAIDALVLKPACTGLGVALAMAGEAAAAGVTLIVTTMLDGAVATRAARALALAIPPERLGICGLGPGSQAQVVRAGAGSPPWAHQAAPLVAAAAAGPTLPVLGPDLDAATLLRRARICARIAHDAGLRPGARVALAARAEPDAVAWLHGLGLAGCEAWLVAPDARAGELRARLLPSAADAGVDAYVADPALPWPDLPHAQVLPPSPTIHLACAETLPALPDRAWPLEEVRVRLWTSGSTGAPKPQALNGRQLYASAAGSAFRLGHAPGDGWLCPLPWHHVGGLSVLLRTAWGHGMAVPCASDGAAIEAAIADERLRIRRVSLTPAQLEAWLDVRQARQGAGEPVAALDALVAVLIGGAELAAPLRSRALAAGLPLARSWGMSEAASQIATTLPGAAPLLAGARGQESLPPLATALVEADAEGRLHIAGPIVARGALATADSGASDQGVRIDGRLDDVVISGGAKIDPSAVEAALCGHAAVAAALVFAVEDPRWGQRPRALLVARGRGGAALPGLATLRATVAARLPAWMAPDDVAWVDALPTVGVGKPSRVAARALWSQLRDDAAPPTPPTPSAAPAVPFVATPHPREVP